MNGCECKSLISTVAEYLNFAKMGQLHSLCLGSVLKIMIFRWKKWATFNILMTSHFLWLGELCLLNALHKEWTLQTVVVSYVMDESIAMWKYVFLWDFEEESISLHCEIKGTTLQKWTVFSLCIVLVGSPV